MSTEFPTRRAAREARALAEQAQAARERLDNQRAGWDNIFRKKIEQQEAARQRTRKFFNEQIARDLISKQPPEWVNETDAGTATASEEEQTNSNGDEPARGSVHPKDDGAPSEWFSNQPAEWFTKQFINEFRERAGIVDNDCPESDNEANQRGHREAVERIEKAAGERIDLVGEWLTSETTTAVWGESGDQSDNSDNKETAERLGSDTHKRVSAIGSRLAGGKPREWFRHQFRARQFLVHRFRIRQFRVRQFLIRTTPPQLARHRHKAPTTTGARHSYRRVIVFASVLGVALLGGGALVLMPAVLAKPGSVIYADQLLSQTNLPTSSSSSSLEASQPSQTAPAQTVKVNPEATSAPVTQESFTSNIPAQNIAPQNAPTPGEISPTFTSTGHANIDWAALVLADAGLPVTTNNVTSILQWMDSENDPQSWYLRNNPLNNGLGSGGGSGLGSYNNLPIAAVYVAQQLQRNLFSGIAAALQANSDPSVTAQAIVTSAWAAGHYNWGSNWHAVDVPVVTAPASAW